MRTTAEPAGMIELTQADYLRDVAHRGRWAAGYFEGIRVWLAFRFWPDDGRATKP